MCVSHQRSRPRLSLPPEGDPTYGSVEGVQTYPTRLTWIYRRKREARNADGKGSPLSSQIRSYSPPGSISHLFLSVYTAASAHPLTQLLRSRDRPLPFLLSLGIGLKAAFPLSLYEEGIPIRQLRNGPLPFLSSVCMQLSLLSQNRHRFVTH